MKKLRHCHPMYSLCASVRMRRESGWVGERFSVKLFITDGVNLLPVIACNSLCVHESICMLPVCVGYPCVRTSCSMGRCVLHRKPEPSLRRKHSLNRQLESYPPIRPTLSIRTYSFLLSVPSREPLGKRQASPRTATQLLVVPV